MSRKLLSEWLPGIRHMNKKCKLISKTYTVDFIGQRVSADIEREIYCDVNSITTTEFINAGQLGLKPEIKVKVWKNEYHGEDELIIDDVYYSIYRTYVDRDGRIELYVQRRVGENG